MFVAIAIVAIIIAIIYYFVVYKETMTDRVDDIIFAIKETIRTKGTITDFRNTLGDNKFSVTKFVYLMDLQRKGNLNKTTAVSTLADTSI